MNQKGYCIKSKNDNFELKFPIKTTMLAMSRTIIFRQVFDYTRHFLVFI